MKPVLSLSVAAVLATSLPLAHAEEEIRLETITVRGTKEGKTYFENPESVSILEENQIPATGRENNLQVLNAVPNVEVNKNGESFSIRGINNTGVTGYQKDNLSSVIVDDVFQTDLAIQAGSFHLWDLDRVEVLRGAQSTNQGINSLAGAILLDHYRPTFANEGGAKLGLGNFWHREAGVMGNYVLIDDRLSVRATYDKEMNDGFITNLTTGNEEWAGWNKDRASLSFLFKANEKDSFLLNGKVHRNRQGGTYVQCSDPFRYEVSEDVDYTTKTDNFQVGGTYTRAISESLTNSLVLGLSRSDQDVENDADGTSANTAGTRIEFHDDHFYSVENRLNYRGERVRNLFGLHAHDFKLTDHYDFDLLFPLGAGVTTPIAVLQGVDRTRQAYAFFDSLTFFLTDKHSLTVGLRGEFVESEYGTSVFGTRTQNLGGANATVDAYLAGVNGTYSGKQTEFVMLPKFGYGYEHGPHHVGLTYTRGYRTSGVGINRRQATAHEYDAEFTNNYEISYKRAGDLIRFGANVFYTDWRDQQVQIQLSNDVYDTQVVNAAKSRLYGAEIESRVKLTDAQSFDLGVGYTDTKFRAFRSRTTDYGGKEFPFASHWTVRFAHDWKITDDLGLVSIARYVSKSYSNAENTRTSEPQFYLNFNAKYVLASWIFEGYVNNALGGEFRIFDGSPTSTTSPYQASYHQTSTPREFGARISYFW